MTHLYIEQATDRTEEVNASIIAKLYELAISGDLDNTSDLKGRLHSSTAKEKHVTYLNNNFGELYISANAQYLSFEDPDVETYVKRYIGNDEGVTLQDVQTFVASNTAFGANYTNTHTNRYGGFTESKEERASINSFDELSLFNGITTIYKERGLAASSINSITLPSSVVRLDTWAFIGCTNLSSINLNNIQYIGGESLKNTNLSGVIDLPNVIQIGDSTRGSSFIGCTGITEVNVGSNFTTFVSGSNFENCTGLTKFTGLSNLTSIEGRTFYGCNALSSVDIDWNKITNVGVQAFMRCYSLQFGELDLSTVTTIPQEAFRECYGITKLLLGNNTTISGSSAFDRCTGITEANLGSGITFNATTTFYGCTNLTTVTGLSGITTLPSWTFSGCTSLSSVDIDWSKITSIGTCALSGCPIGTGQTIELNLTNQSSHFGGALERTKFDKIIVHCNWSGSGDNNHPMFSLLPYTTYIDASDCTLHTVGGGYSQSNVQGDDSLVTVIYPPSVNQIRSGSQGFRNALGTFKYMIILNTTPPDINVDNNNPFSLAFSSNSILHIYVPDSAVSDYLADSKWSQLGGDGGTITIQQRLHGLSELPAGVWTTGLASQYLTPAQLVTT